MIKTLEFNKIIDKLSGFAHSEGAKAKIRSLQPYMSEREVRIRTKETTEARKMLDALGSPPFDTMKDISGILDLALKGGMLIPEQLEQVRLFAAASKRMKEYLKRGQVLETEISGYEGSMDDLAFLREEITLAVRNNRLDDHASKELQDIRRKLEQLDSQVKTKLESILRSKKEMFSDSFVSVRNGRFVVPVKKEYKHQVPGSVIERSATGSTFFIEPSAVMKIQEEISSWKVEESNEERKILYTLTSLVCDCEQQIRLNVEAMEILDFIFAKAKLSSDLDGIPAVMNCRRYTKIVKGRHPLLDPAECVPLDFEIGKQNRGVVITGPNTGGKTVALKTVGLLSAMAQSGLHIPCQSADISMNNKILCDIGDGQSITENLSTFSAHITNIISILEQVSEESLVLLDELGSGTDPAEGMGIAVAILDELLKKNCLFLATTHYPEVKEYAARQEGLINARMAFDRESLKPLYRLEIGEAGESCALYIAKRLGLPKHMLERAFTEAYRETGQKKRSEMDAGFLENAREHLESSKGGKIRRDEVKKAVPERAVAFEIGDSVMVYPQEKIGIICQKSNDKGELGVQIQKVKQLVSYKRLKLKAAAKDMYPPDYDFSIIFDTVENRKARHHMDKKHVSGLEIKIEQELKK